MPLEELRELENKIKTLEEKNAHLEENQMMVVVNHKHYNAQVKKVERDGVQFDIVSWRSRYASRRGYMDPYLAHPGSMPNDPQRSTMDLKELFDRGLIHIDFTEDDTRTTREYVNLSEVRKTIQKEEEALVKESVEEALNRATKAEHAADNIEDKYQKLILDLKDKFSDAKADLNKKNKKMLEDHKAKLEKVEADHKERIAEMQAKIDELLDKKKKKGLEDVIKELKAELETYKQKKPWWKL